MSAPPFSRLICSHDLYWSRKRQAEVCRRCGALSPVRALHFRSKSSWTVGANPPPERAGTGRPADLARRAQPPAEPYAGTVVASLPAPGSAPEAAPSPAGDFSRPAGATTLTDFSCRAAAPLLRPLVS